MPSKSQASQAKKTQKRPVSKRKVVPQTGGGWWPFGASNDVTAAPGAAPVVAPPAPVPAPAPASGATEPAKPGFFSGWFGSKPTEETKKPQPAPENKGSSWWPFGSKSTPDATVAATVAPANGQKGGKKRKSKK